MFEFRKNNKRLLYPKGKVRLNAINNIKYFPRFCRKPDESVTNFVLKYSLEFEYTHIILYI